MASNSENWYLLLGLKTSPTPENDEKVISDAISVSEESWNKNINDLFLGKYYKQYVEMLPQIRKDMTGPDNIREKLSGSAVNLEAKVSEKIKSISEKSISLKDVISASEETGVPVIYFIRQLEAASRIVNYDLSSLSSGNKTLKSVQASAKPKSGNGLPSLNPASAGKPAGAGLPKSGKSSLPDIGLAPPPFPKRPASAKKDEASDESSASLPKTVIEVGRRVIPAVKENEEDKLPELIDLPESEMPKTVIEVGRRVIPAAASGDIPEKVQKEERAESGQEPEKTEVDKPKPGMPKPGMPKSGMPKSGMPKSGMPSGRKNSSSSDEKKKKTDSDKSSEQKKETFTPVEFSVSYTKGNECHLKWTNKTDKEVKFYSSDSSDAFSFGKEIPLSALEEMTELNVISEGDNSGRIIVNDDKAIYVTSVLITGESSAVPGKTLKIIKSGSAADVSVKKETGRFFVQFDYPSDASGFIVQYKGFDYAKNLDDKQAKKFEFTASQYTYDNGLWVDFEEFKEFYFTVYVIHNQNGQKFISNPVQLYINNFEKTKIYYRFKKSGGLIKLFGNKKLTVTLRSEKNVFEIPLIELRTCAGRVPLSRNKSSLLFKIEAQKIDTGMKTFEFNLGKNIPAGSYIKPFFIDEELFENYSLEEDSDSDSKIS